MLSSSLSRTIFSLERSEEKDDKTKPKPKISTGIERIALKKKLKSHDLDKRNVNIWEVKRELFERSQRTQKIYHCGSHFQRPKTNSLNYKSENLMFLVRLSTD